MNVDDNSLTSSPNLDPQGDWWSQHSQNQIRIEREAHHQQKPKQKKKSRGNRKLQCDRKKLRLQGLDEDTIDKRITYISSSLQPDNYDNGMEYMVSLNDKESTVYQNNKNPTEKLKSTKRKRETSTTKEAMLNKSLSQLSISQPLPKKKKQKHDRSSDSDKKKKIKNKKNNKSSTSTKGPIDELPDYLKVPDRTFKQMLCTALDDADKIVQQLDTTEKLEFARQYACLAHRLFYLQLQQEQWDYYFHVGMTDNIWTGQVPKTWAKLNSICHTYGRSASLIEQHQMKIQQQLIQAENALKEFSEQPLPVWMSQSNPPFDLQAMCTAVTAYVRKGQHKLRRHFEGNRRLLILDATDHRLLQAFYDMMPSQQQIHSARLIWKATRDKNEMDEKVAILKHRVYAKILPSSYNLVDHSIDDIEKMLTRAQSTIDQNIRTGLSARRQKKIGQFKYDMLTLTVSTGEEIARSLEKRIKEEKTKFLTNYSTDQNNPSALQLLTALMAAIEKRQAHMIQRAQYISKEKIHSFFDEAPATYDDKNNTNNSVVGAKS